MQTQRARDTQSVWSIDPAKTTVEFAVKKLIFLTVRGSFGDAAGTLRLDPDEIGRSAVEVVMKAASIATGMKRRDAHLRSPDFLAADRYPDIRFRSTRVQPGRDRDTLRITGLLTIRETSGEVVLDVNEVDQSRSPNGEEVVYYNATAEIDRFEFGIKHLRGLIGRRLRIAINLQATRRIEPDTTVT
jgi:polyisoprenoid-binding protein YceI